ncbi:MAG: hypothetical protein ACOYO1_08680 [Bacteroidales bacterium]
MKARFLFIIIFLPLFQISCEPNFQQDNVTAYDRMNSIAINKSLYGISKDSINISCYPTIVTIEQNPNTTSSDSLISFIRYPGHIPLGDCGIQYFVDTLTNRIRCLSENNPVSRFSEWNNSSDMLFSLIDFRGKGIKYIGFRILTVSSYTNLIDYHYGWIKVQLNAKSDSLKIIDFGSNLTKNKSILTAQTK